MNANEALTAVDYDPFAASPALTAVVPSTEAQREIWLACQLGGDATLAYNESVTLHLRGTVDVAALVAAVKDLPARHDALRATFSGDGEQMLIAEAVALDVPIDDLRALPASAREQALAEAATAAVRTPFDLQHGPLLRARLLRLADDHVALLLTAHHIVCDGWSFRVLLRGLAALYATRLGLAEPPLPAQTFAAFAQALVARQGNDAHAADETFWLRQYACLPEPLELPTDRPRPAMRGFTSARIDHVLPSDVIAAVQRLGAFHGVSLFTTLLTGLAALLQRLSGQCETVIGIPSAGQTLPGFETVVGHGVNLLPLRLSIDPARPLSAALSAAQSLLLDAFEHQHYTFGTLLQKLLISREPARLPLTAVMFNLDQRVDLRGFSPLQADLASNPRAAENFELFINAVPVSDGGLRLECQYAAWLFDQPTVTRWLACYEALLRALVQTPDAAMGDLDFVPAADRARLVALNATTAPLPALSLPAWLQRGLPAHASSLALQAGAVRLTHAELWARAHRIAHTLRARGIGRGDRVGLCLPRNEHLLPALLGVLLAGAAYVPLDPSFPRQRLADMAQDAQLALMLACAETAAAIEWPRAQSLWLDADADTFAVQPDTPLLPDPERDATPESVAYIIYTSGSTGKPKGVMVPHRAVVNFLAAVAQRPGLHSGDQVLAVTTLSFDIAVLELLLPLAVGASVLLATREQATDGAALRAMLQTSPVTVLQATPATWRMLLEAGWSGNRRLKAMVGGEALPQDLATQLLDCCGEVWNMYGPTETTVWSTCWQVRADRPIAIGTPLANTQIWIRDERGQLCPIGVPGEIHIGGAGVALGYWQREALTAERFVPDPFAPSPHARLYRTGDRGRWRNDGQLEHLGRLDFQVKLRGFRIELGDIESHLSTHPQVAQAVAAVRELSPGDARLIAYVVPKGPAPEAAELRDHLKTRVPAYMLPQHFVVLDALPLLPNGKVDRKQLPLPETSTVAARTLRRLPQSETEKQIAHHMEAVLHLPGLTVDDDFFALGGHSLSAAQLAIRLREATGRDVQMRTVLEHPTIAGLASWVDSAGVSTEAAPKIVHQADQTQGPASLQQRRVWFIEQLDPGQPTYNTPSAHRLRGPLNVAALECALNLLIERQAALRTFIDEQNGIPMQRVLPALEISLSPVNDLSALPEPAREAELMRQLDARCAEVFDLARPPLFKLGLYRLASDDHVLFFMPHHVIWDGWSFDLFYEELAILYPAFAAGQKPDLPPLRTTYLDYARWQQRWLQSADAQRQLDFWHRTLSALPAPLQLPSDRLRPARMSGHGDTCWFKRSADEFDRLQDFSRQRRSTPAQVLLAAFAAFLAQQSGQNDLIIGTPVRGRPTADLQQIMGFFVNMLPLRIHVQPDVSFADLVVQVGQIMKEALSAPDVPLEELLRLISPSRDRGRLPIYQAFFSYQDARERIRQWGSLHQENIGLYPKAAAEDIRLWLMSSAEGLIGGLTFNTDVFDRARAETWLRTYSSLLDGLMADPDVALSKWIDPAASKTGHPSSTIEAAPIDAARTFAPRLVAAQAAPPATAHERALAQIWAQLLGTEPTVEDNFFDLGGHSLLVTQAIAQMRAATGKSVPPRVYVHESLAQIAARYDAAPIEPPPSVEQKTGGLLHRLFGRRA